MSPHPPVQLGSRLGGYELVRWLGEGGFAEVWLGRRPDAPGEPDVALKIVRRARAHDLKLQTMFLDEAALAARIRHPNVASVYETGDEGGLFYLRMEHVSGGSIERLILGARALEEPVPIAVGVRLMADTCAGLHASHELTIDGRPQHVIHRDVSPQNILITEAGVPKLIDFGIAKARERLSQETSTGIAKGKIAYMSPEQARGGEIDRRADLWAIGAVTYELLEGRRLVEGQSEVVRLQALVNGPIRPTFTRVPPRLAAVLTRAVAFDPEDRQATADELRLDLERALAREGFEASADDVASYCARAQAAVATGERAASVPPFAALLGAPRAAITRSVITPAAAPRSASRRLPRARILAAVAAIALVAIATGLRFGVGHAASDIGAEARALGAPGGAPPPGLETALAALTPKPVPVESTAPAAPPASAAAGRAEPRAPAAARPAKAVSSTPSPARPSPKASDDDQIE